MRANLTKTFVLLFIALVVYNCTQKIVAVETKFKRINVQRIHLDSVQAINPIIDSVVIPCVYDTIIMDHFISKEERRAQYINQVLPSILIVKFRLEQQILRIHELMAIDSTIGLCSVQQNYLDSLSLKYRAKSVDDLLVRLKPHPTSLVLAQSIVESGWGTSRFALEGNNLFGIWTTANDPNVIKSLYDRPDQQIFVKKYNTISESVAHYFLTLGRHKAYRNFRILRDTDVEVHQLIDSLDKYSEMGEEYTQLLKKIIKWNNLEEFDHYRIDESYIVDENQKIAKLFTPCENINQISNEN